MRKIGSMIGLIVVMAFLLLGHVTSLDDAAEGRGGSSRQPALLISRAPAILAGIYPSDRCVVPAPPTPSAPSCGEQCRRRVKDYLTELTPSPTAAP